MATAIPSLSSSEALGRPPAPVAVESGGEAARSLPPAIRLAGVCKRFRKYTRRGGYTTLKSSLLNLLFRRPSPPDNYVNVLSGVDLEVQAGTTIGIVGRNGSGKSTLLKMMAGIIRADAGMVEVRGRISPLIELGAGFHPEFSGRENVYLNGLVLGMSKAETEERYDSIVEFAGLADCIDDPVRTYSSGMYMRLAFSVAVHADPDVLLIDEILAVGDEAFIGKCYERLAAFQEAGKTIVMVTHSLDSIERWCHEAIWLDDGRIVARGAPASVTRLYHESTVPRRPSPEAPVLRDSLNPATLRARIRVLDPPARSPETDRILVRTLLKIKNLGDTVWRALPPTRRGMVMIGGRLYQGDQFLGEIQRAFIPRDLYPAEGAKVELKFPLPCRGSFRIEVDLIAEGICWFADRGSETLSLEISV